MADDLIKKINEALDAREKSAKRVAETVEALETERNVQREIAAAAKATNVAYDAITNNIGYSLKEQALFVNLQEKLNIKISDRKVYEQELIESLKTHSDNTKQIDNVNSQILDSKAKQLDLEQRIIEAVATGQADLVQMFNSALVTEKLHNDELEKQKEIIEQIREDISGEIKSKKELIENEQRYINKLTTQNKLASIGTELLGQMGDLGKHIAEGKFPDWTDVLKKGIMNFLEYDKAAFGLRKSMGLLRGDFDVLQNNVKTLGVELQDLGVSFEQVAASTTAIANEFNMFVASSKELVSDISVISAQLGIAETDSVKFLKTMSSIGNTTVASQKGMIGFAKSMANAAGVPLPAVMKDIAEASDDVRIFTGKSVDNLIKGAVQARQMGTTLQNMANSAKKMLDFQTSIADEMEASVLLGKDVNFEQARNLAYRKDIVGANQEILNVAKKINFDAMDPYQAEAFAKASGKSVQELQEMLQADKEMEHIRRNGTVEQKAQLEKMEQMKRMREDEAKDVGKMAEKRLREQANQERINQLQNQFNKLMSELAQPVMDAIEPMLEFAFKALPYITGGIKALTPAFGVFKFFSYFDKLEKIIPFLEKVGKFGAKIGKIVGFVGKIATPIGKIFGTVLKFSGVFGKFLGPIGLLINAFQFINSLLARWEKTPKGFLGGLEAIRGALYDVFLKPFVDAWDWISSLFVGKSPSKLGLGILDGIKSVGGMILDVLTLPFRTAFNFISGLFGGPKLPKMSDVVFGNKEEKTAGGTASGSDLGTIIAEGNKQVVAKLDELITLMSNGGIAVNIDGSKASMLLARAQKERGAFGAI
jgi:hypothetical protein